MTKFILTLIFISFSAATLSATYTATDDIFDITADDPSKLFSRASQSRIYNPDTPDETQKNFCMTNYGCTAADTVVSKDYTEFLFSFAAFNKVRENDFVSNCKCLNETFSAQYPADELKREKDKARAEANKKIKEAFGKKFVNDFSSNLEDLSFFLTKNRDMFKNPEKAKLFQCLDPDGFNDQIDFICGANGITDPEFIRQRKDFFINSVDKGNLPFEQRLMKMSEDIVSMEYPEAPGFPKGTMYSRLEYDSARMGLAHSDPQTKIVEEILKKAFLSNAFMGEVIEDMENMTPAMAIEQELIRRKDTLGLSPEALKVVSDSGKLKSHFQFLMNTHPGFMSLMEDKEAVRNLFGENQLDPSKSILEQLESNPNVLEPVWESKCLQMQEQYALAVCTPDDKLISVMGPDDFSRLTKTGVDDLEAQMGTFTDLLMCEENNKNTKKFDGLSKMNKDSPYHRSDYLERITEPDVKKHQNMFSKSMLASMHKKFRKHMSVMFEKGQLISKSVPLAGVLSAKVYAQAITQDKAFSFGKQAMSKSEAKALLKADKEYTSKLNQAKLAKKEKEKPRPQESQQTIQNPQIANTNTAAVQAPQTVVAPQAQLPRQQLQRKLAETYRPSQITQALNKLNDENAAELNSLRSQNMDLLQRTYELESQRMDSMQKKVDELQTRVDKASERTVAPTVVNQTTPSSKAPEEASSIVPAERVQERASATQSDQVASSGAAPVADSPSEPSNGRSRPSVIQSEAQAPVLPASLTVDSADDKVKEEVTKLLENPESPLPSLEEIKAHGLKLVINNKEVIVKYESLDQKFKDLLELKFAKKERDQQVSKLAVLRMLIAQKTAK